MLRLKARDISVRRGDDLLIDRLDFDVSGGESLIVTGRNGSGKSTLIRAVAGLIHAEGGTVTLEGANHEIGRVSEACHYLGHRNAMKRDLTVFENLAFWKSFLGSVGDGPAIEPEEAAEAIGLSGLLDLPFGYLSAGQQRRMAFAKLLVAHRPVWLLDEPTAALDGPSESLLAALVNRHLAAGGLALIATHQPLDIAPVKSLVMAGFAHLSERA